MCTVEYFTRLFTYDSWANHEVLTALRSSNEPPARALKLIAHILAAERLWLARLEKNTLTFTAQAAEGVTYARKIDKSETHVDWTRWRLKFPPPGQRAR